MSTTSNETLGPLSAQEKSSASDYLASTRDALLQAVGELSLEQWRFKPTADRWMAINGFWLQLLIPRGIRRSFSKSKRIRIFLRK